jgi:hypothetical protein
MIKVLAYPCNKVPHATSIGPFIATGAGLVQGWKAAIQPLSESRLCAQYAHYDFMPVHRCITPAMEVRVSDSQRA